MTNRSSALIGGAAIVLATAGALAAVSLPQPSGKSQQSSRAPEGNAQNGKALYEKYGCWACHGYVGQGGAGRRLAPNPIPLPSFTAIVRRPPSQMPPYTEKVLSNRELADIHAYLGTIPPPPDPATIPLLQETEGTNPAAKLEKGAKTAKKRSES